MTDALLILNAGSSSLKFSVFLNRNRPELLLRGQIDGLLDKPHFVARDPAGTTLGEKQWPAGQALAHHDAIEFLLHWGQDEPLAEHRIVAAGHRVVHGGIKFTQPVVINQSILTDLEALVPLAPLHQPHHLAVIRAVARHQPDLPQIACFDTAFHRTQPAVAQTFALPPKFADVGVRRYGFHGLSYEYITSVLGGIDPKAASGRTVIAHLGNGASMCAVQNGRSIATTMSFTPLDGLPMGTRSGSIDPAVLLYLMRNQQMDVSALQDLLYHQSGLLGVSGISSDVRTLLASSDPRAQQALDLLVYRIGRELGSLAAALGGLDSLIFTGGIGENAATIRAQVCRSSRWLGVELNEDANLKGGPRISQPGSAVSAWVIPTNEELMIALHTRQLIDK